MIGKTCLKLLSDHLAPFTHNNDLDQYLYLYGGLMLEVLDPGALKFMDFAKQLVEKRFYCYVLRTDSDDPTI